MLEKNSKTMQLDKTDIKSIIHYLVILIAWGLVATLPQMSELLTSMWVDPAMVGFVVSFLGVVLKKLLQDNSK